MRQRVLVTGGFDDVRSRQIRFLEEAAKFGDLTVGLWSDDLISRTSGRRPKFSQAERAYFVSALRYVKQVRMISTRAGRRGSAETKEKQLALVFEELGSRPDLWVADASPDEVALREFCGEQGVDFRVLRDNDLVGFPDASVGQPTAESGRKKVLVTGCYDWFHSGHVRFFEEVSAYGEVYAVVGHDANIRLLKGEGHPLFPQAERRYVVQSIRFVKQALVSTGEGWLDAEPEILRIKPDIYAVNEDGDRPVKREYCERRGLEYLVLKRTPAPGLPKRTSTDLRGF
jgi:cytidyltransferase-like protein